MTRGVRAQNERRRYFAATEPLVSRTPTKRQQKQAQRREARTSIGLEARDAPPAGAAVGDAVAPSAEAATPTPAAAVTAPTVDGASPATPPANTVRRRDRKIHRVPCDAAVNLRYFGPGGDAYAGLCARCGRRLTAPRAALPRPSR